MRNPALPFLSLRFLSLTALLFVLGWLPNTPLLAEDMTILQIKVTNEKGKPIGQAHVRIVFKQGRRKINLKKIRHSWELNTSQEGTVKIPAVPKGDILVQVTAKNYQSYGDTLTIEEDERTVEVKLKDPQKQYSVHGDLKQ